MRKRCFFCFNKCVCWTTQKLKRYLGLELGPEHGRFRPLVLVHLRRPRKPLEKGRRLLRVRRGAYDRPVVAATLSGTENPELD